MNNSVLERHFARIGARCRLRADHWAPGLTLDVRRDARGEFFDLAVSPASPVELSVLHVAPRRAHLVLMSVDASGNHKFLCGHDERHWFAAAVPERSPVCTVESALLALKPFAVRRREGVLGVKPRRRNRRRNEAFVRQGEWFFLPAAADFRPDAWLVRRNEPLRRGRGKPHVCEQLVRAGGEPVYVSVASPQGVDEREFKRLLDAHPHLRRQHWVQQRRNPQVFVRGKIRHPDHATIEFDDWRQVLMNTETQSLAMRHVAFLD